MKKTVSLLLCFVSGIIGAIIGGYVGEQIGIAALPPHAWAGDGIGILIDQMEGVAIGAGIGIFFGVIGILSWRRITRKRAEVVSEIIVADHSVWPPPPTLSP